VLLGNFSPNKFTFIGIVLDFRGIFLWVWGKPYGNCVRI
jgi:hypothetical protein